MLHDLRFETQGDHYTCKAYVLAGRSTVAESQCFLPEQTFASRYDANLTEEYRLMAPKFRAIKIINAAEEKKTLEVREAEV